MRTLRFLIAGVAVLAIALALLVVTNPDVSGLAKRTPDTTAFMERRKKELRARGRSDHLDRFPVPLARISLRLRRATIVTEDARFYEHGGVDWQATKAALESDIARREFRTGGSTITQQLAKNLYLSPSRTPWRKLRELAIAWDLERTLTKDRILELYLNSIEWGDRTFGAEAACRRYFGHSAENVSDEEAATLAAMIASPLRYQPDHPSRRFRRRIDRVLRYLHPAGAA